MSEYLLTAQRDRVAHTVDMCEHHLSCFSVAMTRHTEQSNFRKEVFPWLTVQHAGEVELAGACRSCTQPVIIRKQKDMSAQWDSFSTL